MSGAAAGRRLVDEANLYTTGPLRPGAGAPPTSRVSVAVNLDGWAKEVPSSFLGISHEWVDVDELTDPEALLLLKDLQAYGTGTLP